MNSDSTKEDTRKRSLKDGCAFFNSENSCFVNKLEVHETEVNYMSPSSLLGILGSGLEADDNFVKASSIINKKSRFMDKMYQQDDVPETSGKTCEPSREGGHNCSDKLNIVSNLSLSDEKNCEEKVLASDAEGSTDVSRAIINGQDILSESSHSLVAVSPRTHLRKKLIVLDVNGLLADIVFPPPKDYQATATIAGRAIFKRPFCDDFLKFCFERFEVAIWSSRTRKNVDKLIDILMGDLRSKLLFCWDASHCTMTQFKTPENKHKPLVFKELKRIWDKHDLDLSGRIRNYDESNTLLIDDSPHKALLNPPHTAIFPYSYEFKDENDKSLGDGGDLKEYLERLDAAENMQKFIEQNPFGQNAITEGSSNWSFYLEVISSCVPPNPSLNVHQVNQRLNPSGVLADMALGFDREWQQAVMDKVFKSPPQARWVSWARPPNGHLKLNTSGSVCATGRSAAAGGLIRDELGNWRGGFAVHIGATDRLMAELFGLREGLQILKQMGALGAAVETDSDVALRLVSFHDFCHPYGGVVRDCCFLLAECYVSDICHTPREGNRCADSLANIGHSLAYGVTFFDHPPLCLNHLLLADMQGLRWLPS